MKNFPKALVGIGAGVVSVMLVLGCSLSFMAAMGIEGGGSGTANLSERPAHWDNQVENHQVEFDLPFNRSQQQSQTPDRTDIQARVTSSEPKDKPPFDLSKASPNETFPSRFNPPAPNKKLNSGFSNSRFQDPTSAKVDDLKLRGTLKIREVRESKLLQHVRRTENLENFDFGNAAGRDAGTCRVFFDRESALTGITFAANHSILVPAKDEDRQLPIASLAEPTEHLIGFKSNFRDNRLKGIQPIFAKSLQANPNEFRYGNWLGEQPIQGDGVPVTSEGHPIHGFLVYKKFGAIGGLQLLIKK